ncbi:uncharacterized protein I206_102628 [Kwoniella pini CBS 10737]|uniref:Calpain catalytic domain-containing protein n=1 Tax=Kwoniella pini CBS 10737 TaxID=1296096 RepID=A0AAJ8L180_9TREE
MLNSLLYLLPLLGLGLTVIPLGSASPIDSGMSATEQIVKRDDHPLWLLQPKPVDILADKFKDDWLLAAAAALANTYPEKIQVLFSNVTDTKSETDNVDETMVKVWNNEEWQKWNNLPDDQKGGGPSSKEHKVVYSNITADYSGANQYWWIAALENAFIQEGGYDGITSNGFVKGDPHIALKMMTGLSAKLYNANNTQKNDLWYELRKSARRPTCVKIQWPEDADNDNENLWNAVLRVEPKGEYGTVYMFNSKIASEAAIEFEDLVEGIKYYVHQEEP